MTSEPRHPTRRTLLRSAGVLGAAGATAALLAACAPEGAPRPSVPTAASPGSRTSSTPGAPTMPGSPSSSVLIAYFSRPGENYYYGDRRNLRIGNTEVLTGLLTDRIDADVFRIEAQDPYSSSYDATRSRNVREQESDARPGIAGDLPSLDGYDVVLLGSPIWNVRPPMIMSTFAEAVDWTGKTLHPYVTYAVSRLGDTEQVYRDAAEGATLGAALAVQGETVADAADDAAAWLRRIGLL